MLLGGVERLFQSIGSSSSGKQTFSLAVETAEIGQKQSLSRFSVVSKKQLSTRLLNPRGC